MKSDPSSTNVDEANKTDSDSVDLTEASDEDVIESTEAKLQALFGDEEEPAEKKAVPPVPTSGSKKEDDQTDDGDDEEDSTPEEDDTEEEVTDDEEDTEEDAEEEVEEEVEQKEEFKLNDAYLRAAIQRGWSEEEVNDFVKANPELAGKTLGKIYEGVKRANEEFASFGRARKEGQRKQTEEKNKVEEQKKEEYKGIDVSKLREEYPDDKMLVDLVEATQEQTKALREEISQFKTSNPNQQPDSEKRDAEVATAAKEIDGFFRTEVKGYEDFYGSVPKDAIKWDDLSPGQRANRWALVEMVDDMMVGAEANGRTLSSEEAFQRAHLNVSDSFKEKVIREDIVKKMKKRSKNLTLKPSNSSKSPESKGGKPIDDKEIEARAEARLAKTFGRN